MKLLLLSICLGMLPVCQAQQTQPLKPTGSIPPKVEAAANHKSAKPANPLVGIWKSNGELTLASLNTIEGISDDSREYLKQNVFGLLTREFTATDTRAYFGKVKPGDQAAKFLPYKIIESNDNKIVIEHTDPLTDKIIRSTLFLESSCYYELVSKWQYKEYFCRQDENAGKKFIAVPKTNQEQLKH